MEVAMLHVGAGTSSVANTSWNVGVDSFVPVLRIGKGELGESADQEKAAQEDILRDVLKKTADLLSLGDRGLKFEMIEEADMYQLQVIDMTDGRVVRKIPPDEVLKMITLLKEQISDHVDVVA